MNPVPVCHRPVLLWVCLLVAGFAPSSRANLVSNGSFETGTNPGVYLTLGDGDNTTITGWTVGGALDYVGSAWVASDGSRSLDLNAASSDPAGSISQTFATTPGATYSVTFDLAGNPTGLPVVKDLRVSADGQSMDFDFDTTGASVAAMGWATESWSFVADDASATLTFTSLIASTSYGPALDNVIVEAIGVPEPASAIILAVASIGLARRRRDQKCR